MEQLLCSRLPARLDMSDMVSRHDCGMVSRHNPDMVSDHGLKLSHSLGVGGDR